MSSSVSALAVIPSLSRSPGELKVLTDDLRSAGFEPLVVVTGRTLDGQLSESDIPRVSPHANPGFGAAVTVGAEQGTWDWLAIVNDDVVFDADLLREHLRPVLARDPAERVLCYLDPVSPKAIPSVRGTVAELSLVASVVSRLRRQAAPEAEPDPRRWFRPFSFALVSRGLWDHLGGFDDRLPYTFEDADFGRRAGVSGAEVLFSQDSSVRHDRSSTSGRYLDTVLPVAAWSAAGYLQTLGVAPRRARLVCAAALVVRLALIPFSGSPSRKHALGTLRGARSLWLDRQPALPAYDSI
jgi:GT2 family glycosyltransferase